MATCAVSTVKNEPKTTLKTKIVNDTPKNESIRSVGLIFALSLIAPDKTRRTALGCLCRDVLDGLRGRRLSFVKTPQQLDGVNLTC
jgi:hypothetical protein